MSHPNTIRFVGLDVHKDTIAMAVADSGPGSAKVLATLPNDFTTLSKALARLGPPDSVSCGYEAGPTGFGLARQLNAAGWTCVVVAPSLIPVQSGCRIKTDRRDAAKLAHFLRSGDLTTIYVPDEATEAIRDLERARDDAKRAERVARHQLAKFLLRHGATTRARRPGTRPIVPGSPSRASPSRPSSGCWPMAWERSSRRPPGSIGSRTTSANEQRIGGGPR